MDTWVMEAGMNGENTAGDLKSLRAYFLGAFAFSWFFWLIGVLASFNVFSLPFPNTVLLVVGAHGPLVSAVWLTHREKGWVGVRGLLRAGFDLKVKPIWWLWMLGIPFVLGALAVWLAASQTGYQADRTLLSQPLMVLPTFLFMFFLGGSFQEEFGWRGYALPRLLRLWNPLGASIILGLIWGTWHWPLFYMTGVSQQYMPFGLFVLLAAAFSVLFTWFFNSTGRNLFTALFFHAAINTSFSLFPPVEMAENGNQAAFTYTVVLYLLVTAVVVFASWKKWLGVER